MFEIEPACDRCPALAECRNRIAWGNGPLDADVMVVGEAPGAGDQEADRWQGGNWTGMAYTAKHSGRRIRETMATVGYPDSFYTNAVNCFPAAPEDPTTNREPSAEELANCRDHLRTELDRIEPTAVVTTGKHATASMLAFENESVSGFVDSVLEPRPLDSLDVTLVPVLHPAYRDVWLSRLGYEKEDYLAELGRVLDGIVE